jgi:hypothetical protein
MGFLFRVKRHANVNIPSRQVLEGSGTAKVSNVRRSN